MRHILVKFSVKFHEALFNNSHLVTSTAVDRQQGTCYQNKYDSPPLKKLLSDLLLLIVSYSTVICLISNFLFPFCGLLDLVIV